MKFINMKSILGGNLIVLTVLSMLFFQAPESAKAAIGDGATSNILLQDPNGNGVLDRITFDIANPNSETWSLNGALPHGLSVSSIAGDISITAVSITSAPDANPVTIQVDLDENDPQFTFGVDTKASALELSYAQGNGGAHCSGSQACITDGNDEEMNAIAEDSDVDDSDTELDGAAPVVKRINYWDVDKDGKIDQLVLHLSEAIDDLSHVSANDVLLVEDGDFNDAEIGTDTVDLATGIRTSITVPLAVESTVMDTYNDGSELQIELQNAFYLVDDAGNETVAGDTVNAYEEDQAAPQIDIVGYGDSDFDGYVDRLRISFTETLDESSFVSNNDFLISDVGDFIGLSAQTTTVDLVTFDYSATFVTMTLNESSVQDTHDDSGLFEVSTQNGFKLVDEAGNTTFANGVVTGAELRDEASPHVKAITYEDVDGNGKIDQFTFEYSEMLDASTHISANDLVFTNDGGFTGFNLAEFGTDTVDLVTTDTTTVVVPLGSEPTVYNTHNQSGFVEISSQNDYDLNTPWGVYDGFNLDAVISNESVFVDAAPPIPYILRYFDDDGDAKVDAIQFLLTESVEADSVWSANDALVTDESVFTGIAFGTDPTDLITFSTDTVHIPLGTEATVQKTYSEGVAIEVDFQNGFYLVDESGNETTAPWTFDGLRQDYAKPQILDFEYQDADVNGKIDQVFVTFSEILGSASVVSESNFTFDNVGDFTGAEFGTDTTDLIIDASQDTVTIPFATEATVVDTQENSGLLEISIDSMLIRGIAGNKDEYILDGAALLATYSDGAGMIIAETSPTDGSTVNSLSQSILVTFSEEMDTTTIDDFGSEVSVFADPGGLAASFTTDTLGRTVLEILHNDFSDDEFVEVKVDELAEALDGSILMEDYFFSFTANQPTSSGGGGGGGGSSTPKTYTVTVDSPNGGESFDPGDNATIEWTTGGTGSASFVNILVSYDDGSVYESIASGESNDGVFTWTVPDIASTNAFVKIESTDLVAVLATDVSDAAFGIGSSAPEPEVLGETDEGTGVEVSHEVMAGEYIKGESFDTVYYVTEDMKRRPFMNEQTYFTWQDDFDVVKVVADELLPDLNLGSPMLPQAGTVLIKIQSIPDVFVTEENSADDETLIKRLIATEELAIELLGDDWADYVVDIEPTLYKYFIEGDEMKEGDSIDMASMQKRMGL